jgi:hypothetical protein
MPVLSYSAMAMAIWQPCNEGSYGQAIGKGNENRAWRAGTG